MNYKNLNKADLIKATNNLGLQNTLLGAELEATNLLFNEAKEKNAKLNTLVESIEKELPTNKFWWWEAIRIIKAIIDLINGFKK